MHLLPKGQCCASLPRLDVINLQQIISFSLRVINKLGAELVFPLFDLLESRLLLLLQAGG